MGLRERSDRLSFNEGIFIHRVFERLFREYPQFRERQDMANAINLTMDRLYSDSDPKMRYIKILWQPRLDNFIDGQIEYFNRGYRVICTQMK